MKKFIKIKVGTTYPVLAMRVEECTAKCISRAIKHPVIYYDGGWCVTFESYLVYKDVVPEDINYNVVYNPGIDESDAVVLTYRGMDYSQVRMLKTIFGEDNFRLEGNYNGCGHIDVYYKIQYDMEG